MARKKWRQPTVIWLYALRKNRYWKRKRRNMSVAGMPKAKRMRSQRRPWRPVSWTSWAVYGGVLMATGLVLWQVPPQSLPVTGRLGHSRSVSAPSIMDRAIHTFRLSSQSFRGWLKAGMPLIRWAEQPGHFSIQWQSVVMAGLADISGVRLTSLSGLLRMEIPALSVVSHPTAVTAPIRSQSQDTQAQNQRDPSLPGDKGRVWAALGSSPEVGIYQTHSHESFYPALPKGAASPYTTQWSKTIVQVGWWLAQDIHSHGIPVVQSRVDNMSQGLLASYNQSYYTAKKLLAWYPKVRLLLDVHRSSSNVSAVKVHGVKMAPLVIVVGTNNLLPNPYWHQNLEVALKLSKALKQVAPGLLSTHGIDMVPYRYNQQLMPGDLMVEVGGPNSTMAEERYAVHELAAAVAEVIHQGQIPAIPRGKQTTSRAQGG